MFVVKSDKLFGLLIKLREINDFCIFSFWNGCIAFTAILDVDGCWLFSGEFFLCMICFCVFLFECILFLRVINFVIFLDGIVIFKLYGCSSFVYSSNCRWIVAVLVYRFVFLFWSWCKVCVILIVLFCCFVILCLILINCVVSFLGVVVKGFMTSGDIRVDIVVFCMCFWNLCLFGVIYVLLYIVGILWSGDFLWRGIEFGYGIVL